MPKIDLLLHFVVIIVLLPSLSGASGVYSGSAGRDALAGVLSDNPLILQQIKQSLLSSMPEITQLPHIMVKHVVTLVRRGGRAA